MHVFVGSYTTQQLIGRRRTAYSLPLANLEACSSIVSPHGRILSLEPLRGCYLLKYFELIASHDISTLDTSFYSSLSRLGSVYQPSIIFANASLRHESLDYSILRKISRQEGAYLIADISTNAGLFAAGLLPSPFRHIDIATMSTQGSLCGPCGALIFYRRELQVPRLNLKNTEQRWQLEHAVNASVFPGHQGGPHAHTIAGIAVALKQASSSWFKQIQEAAVANAAVLQHSLQQKGLGVHGNEGQSSKRALELDAARSTKEMLHCVGSEVGPVVNDSYLLLGSIALTFKGFEKEHFQRIADILDHAIQVTRTWEAATKAPNGQQSEGNIEERWPIESEPDILSLKLEVKSLMEARLVYEKQT